LLIVDTIYSIYSQTSGGRGDNVPKCHTDESEVNGKTGKYKPIIICFGKSTRSSANAEIARDADVGAHSLSL